ncbi:OmpA family protein [Flavobacterium amniphilum]|uniref:OmpA family protein n=1 Tax=Flavobacterium amniphilum TaxID=1834035 RepID=UPI00202A6DF2|nr:OmpA family protein [Flavobacterium amniphilum]MCL9806108.1 OmpA family protein [Flavobacterium amniphilum]
MRKIYMICVLLFGLQMQAQQTKVAKGDTQFNDLAYIDATETYLKVAKKGYKSKELFQKLGDSYYFNANLKEANKWYTELFALGQPIESEYYYRYSQTLKAAEDYKKADEYLDKFYKLSANDIRANLYNKQRDYKKTIEKNSGRYEVKSTTVNTRKSDYGTAFFGDKVVFSTSRDTTGFARVQTRWTNQSFTNFYVSNRTEENDLTNPERFSKTINSKFHEDTPVFTKDLKTVYFTRNNFTEGKIGRDEKQVINLKLYKAVLNAEGKWENVTELPFNSNAYSVAHPALSPDEKTLYFASNMPGTNGQSDIFKVAILGENQYGTPEKLSNAINTEARETFPFVTQDNELYFASDGHQGLGGLDVFVTKINTDGSIGPVVNLGAPINGPMDDFAFIIDNSTRKGYFSSNRNGGKGLDDIYSFTEKEPLVIDCKSELAGLVTDAETGVILPGSTVSLFDDKFNLLSKVTTDGKSSYQFEVKCGQKYYVRAEQAEYETKEQNVVLPDSSGKTDLPIALSKKLKEIKPGTDLAKTFNIKIIYFDLDKSNIRSDAQADLAKIAEIMKEFPTMKVDVRSHTDSRQTNAYNEKLSSARAKSTIDWLVKNGIEKERLSGRGYGESQLINHCGDGVNCSEEEHQMNRRSEFIILKM